MNPSLCGVTTGFFVLGRCRRPAVAMCQCGRPVCAEHAGPNGLCPECAAAQGYGADPFQPGWARGYRRTYYRRASHDYGDVAWYSTFDDFDRGAFNPGRGYAPDYGGDDGPDFVDS